MTSVQQPAVRDENAAHPVASAWRPTLCEIVKAFVRHDYALNQCIPSVAPVSAETAREIERYVADYGETLCELPDETWATSVAQWTGSHWDVLVDLWTVESGRSDMVLDARVFETNDGLSVEIHFVCVP
jgi:hypothetical protein